MAQYITANNPALRADVVAGHGPTLDGLYAVTKTPVKNQTALARELSRGQTQNLGADPEPIVVAVMVHS